MLSHKCKGDKVQLFWIVTAVYQGMNLTYVDIQSVTYKYNVKSYVDYKCILMYKIMYLVYLTHLDQQVIANCGSVLLLLLFLLSKYTRTSF